MYQFDWQIFWSYVWPPTAFKNPLIANGFFVTVYMAVLAQTIGTVLGGLGAVMQLSRHRAVRWMVSAYVIWFRGTPLLVQISLLYFGLATLGLYAFPAIEIFGLIIPGAIQAGIIGLALNEAAFMTEIFRAGISSIDKGQTEAAKAIGMTFRRTMWWIVLPQAARVVVPPLGNEFNNMLKSTTLVVVIGGVELFNAFQQVNARLFHPFELFLAASFYFLALTLAWGAVQSWIERRLGDNKGEPRPRTLSRLFTGDAATLRTSRLARQR